MKIKKYLNTKTFSKILALSVLVNSIPINSLAGILSEDGRYETFEGDNITIDNILEEDKVDVEIEGNTIVNVANQKDSVPITKNYTVEGTNHIPLQGEYDGKTRPVIEGNTMYYNNDTGKLSDTFIEGANLSLVSGFENQLVTQEMIDNGQEKAENLGKYKVEYKVTGKNKFNVNNIQNNKYQNCNTENGNFTISSNQDYTNSGFIEVNPNTTYTISGNFESGAYYTIDKKAIKTSRIRPVNTIITPEDCYYIVLNGKYRNHNLNNLQVEEGYTITEYEPYRESTKTFYLNSPLLEGDTIEDVDGKATHIKRYGKIVLNGSEKWVINEPWTTDNTMAFYSWLKNKKGGALNIISDKFNTKLLHGISFDYEGTWGEKSNTVIYIRINKSKLPSLNSTGLKQWLQDNPTTVVYQLETPIYETISEESMLCDSYVNGHLDLNTNIPVNKVDFMPTTTNLNYLYPSTEYTVQFESDNKGKIDTVLLGDKVLYSNYSVSKGINRFNITTPNEISSTELILDGVGFSLFNLVITEATNESFDYFEGIKSVGQDDENGHNIEIISTNSDKTQFNKTKIPLSEPLRSLPNGIKDKIIKRKGQWYVERNIGEIILDGSESWVVNIVNEINRENTMRFMLNTTLGVPKIDDIVNMNSDKFICERNKDTDAESIQIWGSTKEIKVRVLKKSLITQDEIGFKEWLSQNPVKIVYQLDNPIYEPVNVDLSAQLFKETTYISTNSTIPANLKVIVDRTINRATEAIELAKTNPTVANLSRARYWTNLLKESTKKDELQEEINNNVDIVDLQLERKTASANLDIYIKCENMLSMSLDTSQISFDDFSGVEDLEKQNAIAISVNSSLPYQLNSYLVSEIQNSDKSKIMDKDILNIRENSECEYKTFNDINEKLVLKDNIAQGNDNVHNIDLMLKSGLAFEKDIYKATIKFEAEQK